MQIETRAMKSALHWDRSVGFWRGALRRRLLRLSLVVSLGMGVATSGWTQSIPDRPSRDLKVSVLDVDGGAAVLFVTPEGKSLLIDTGWEVGAGRGRPRPGESTVPPTTSSAERIVAAATKLGVKKIDYLVLTHYHSDHAGGFASLLEKMPVGTLIDHGVNTEPVDPEPGPCRIGRSPEKLYETWVAALPGHEHIPAQAGQKLKIGSLELQFVASDGHLIGAPLAGAGAANALCASVPKATCDGGEENVRSLGMVLTFGKTRVLDLGDLTWNKELELMCPVNKIGKVDLYLVTGHGMDLSSSPPTAALAPVVAVMQNGPMKGGDAVVVKTVRGYPGLEGLWQSHGFARNPELNGDPDMIANPDQQPDGAFPIEVTITPGGVITVRNARNGATKEYRSRAGRKGGK